MKWNPYWWNAKICKLGEVVALPLEDLDTAYNRFLDGNCDWLRAIPLPKIEEIKRNPDFFVSPYLGTYFYGFNVTKPPFDDVRVRKAFNQAVDKEAICRDVLRSGEKPATGYVPPGIPGYSQLDGLPYDPKEARRLLQEAGYRTPDSGSGREFPAVELLYNTSERHKLITEAVGKMWEEILGVTVQLRNTEWKVYLDMVDNLQFSVSRRGWIGDYTDPNTFMDMFVTGGGNNNTGWSNARYDELISGAARELDPEKRFDMFREAERILCVDELPILPVFYYVNQGMVAEHVQGIYPNLRDLHPFQYISIER
jgi:oligopeptide transport system substrate-binding protein